MSLFSICERCLADTGSESHYPGCPNDPGRVVAPPDVRREFADAAIALNVVVTAAVGAADARAAVDLIDAAMLDTRVVSPTTHRLLEAVRNAHARRLLRGGGVGASS